MKIKTVALLGAGAVGAYFIYGMAEKMGGNFCVVAEGERKARLEKNGININGKDYALNVKTPEEAAGVDLLLISTKYDGLIESLDAIETIVRENTIVISLLNGIDSEDMISERVGAEHVIYSFMKIVAARKDATVTFNPETTVGLLFGEKGTSKKSERVLAIMELLDEMGLHYQVEEDIISSQWTKFAMNITFNLPQAILGIGYGSYFDSAHVDYINQKLLEEVKTVANAKNIKIAPLGNTRDTCHPSARFSTLQDLDAKRHTEVDMFLGVFIKIAGELGISVPFSEYTYHAIKALEEKNDGKFDY